MTIHRRHRRGERGQVLILCAVCLTILLLFVGLAIDFGQAYVTKARLGKAADAAALTGARYSARGVSVSTALAQSAFAMNYGGSTLDNATATVTFPTDSGGGTLVNVSASANTTTYFLGLLPQFRTLSVSANSQARAARVELTLVLDSSGSMGSDGGSTYLPGAVTDFIGYFDDVKDSVALVSFSTLATTQIPMRRGSFQKKVVSIANSLNYAGHTFSDLALQEAFTQEETVVPGNVVKVVVFFTDGGANTIQNYLACGNNSSLPSGTWDFGGQDPSNGLTPPSTAVSFMDPSTGADQGCTMSSSNCCRAQTFPSASVGKTVAPAWSSGGPAVTPWSQGGTPVSITYGNVQADALYRAIGDAIAMRKQGIIVYSIGLGSAPSPVDPSFLCQVANDPTCSAGAYDPTLPAGEMVWAATGTDLDAAFQKVATLIRLRLTQ